MKIFHLLSLFQNRNKDHVFLNIFILPDQIVLLIINVLTSIEKSLGKQLAIETDIKADLVVPVPDSGVASCFGLCRTI